MVRPRTPRRGVPTIAFLVLLGLSVGVFAAESHTTVPTNAVATGSNSAAGTNAALVPLRAATNGLKAISATNAASATTNVSAAATTNLASALDDTYKLTIGDRVSFKILEDEEDDPVPTPVSEEPKPLFVTDAGDIEVPYIGRVTAENKTCRQLAAEIKAALEKEYYYQATVIIAVDLMSKNLMTGKSHGRVYLVGAVRLPGPVEVPNDEVLTLSKAILRAGGFTDYADRRHVKVTRKDAPAKDAAAKEAATKEAASKGSPGKDDKQTFTVDVGEIFDKGKIEMDVDMEPGDLIYVPERLIRF